MAGIGELGRIEVWVRKEMTTLKLGKGKEDSYDIIIRQERRRGVATLVKKMIDRKPKFEYALKQRQRTWHEGRERNSWTVFCYFEQPTSPPLPPCKEMFLPCAGPRQLPFMAWARWLLVENWYVVFLGNVCQVLESAPHASIQMTVVHLILSHAFFLHEYTNILYVMYV